MSHMFQQDPLDRFSYCRESVEDGHGIFPV